MRQRAMIAMALSCEPELLIADEPTTALDVTVQAQVLEVLKTAQEETGAATVLITHDLGVVAGIADRITVMYAGRPVEQGTVDDVFYNPRMPYTIGLLGSLPRLDATEKQRLTPIKGSPPSLINPPPGCPFGPRCPLHVDECEREEPPLRAVDGVDHTAACIRSDELVGTDVTPEEIFSTDASDSELAAATALGGHLATELPPALAEPATAGPALAGHPGLDERPPVAAQGAEDDAGPDAGRDRKDDQP
jgi:peptide/nickel transport system ATP-binding protein